MSSGRLTAAQRAKVFKALADAHRVAIVDALAKHGPLCGTELADRLGISVALVSHHWEVLVEAGLIQKTRVGQLRYCSLDAEKLHEATSGWDDLAATIVELPAAKPWSAAKKTPAKANAAAAGATKETKPAKPAKAKAKAAKAKRTKPSPPR